MLFYQVGELFQGYAVGKSRQSITEMMDICPEYANVEEDGKLVTVDPDAVEAVSYTHLDVYKRQHFPFISII